VYNIKKFVSNVVFDMLYKQIEELVSNSLFNESWRTNELDSELDSDVHT